MPVWCTLHNYGQVAPFTTQSVWTAHPAVMQCTVQERQPLRLLSLSCTRTQRNRAKIPLQVSSRQWMGLRPHNQSEIQIQETRNTRALKTKATSSQPESLFCFYQGKNQFLNLYQPEVCRWTPSTKDLVSVKPGLRANAASFQLRSMFSLLDQWAKHSRAGSFSKGVKYCHMRPRKLSPKSRVTLAPWLPRGDATVPDWVSPG